MIEKEIEEIATELGFTISEYYIKNLEKKNFVILCQKNQENIVLKVTGIENDEIIQGHKREFLNSNLVYKYNSKLPDNQKITVTRLFDQGSNKKYFWVTREFFEGLSLSHDMEAYNKIDERFYESADILLPQIIRGLKAFNLIGDHFDKNDMEEFQKISKSHYDFELEKISKDCKGEQVVDIEDQKNFYQSIYKEYLRNSKVVMGDFHPANILIDENNSVTISDLNFMHFDNYTFDVAYLFLFLRNEPDWQKQIINSCIKTEEDKKFFRASIIRITLPLAWKNADEKDDPIWQEKHKYWRKYLIAAGESFEAIIEA